MRCASDDVAHIMRAKEGIEPFLRYIGPSVYGYEYKWPESRWSIS